jgi:DNA repair photolyase
MQQFPGYQEAKAPTPGGRVTYTELRPMALLRQEADASGGWHWGLNPYEGCGFGCTFCRLRLDRKDFGAWREFEKRIGVKANAVELLMREVRALDGDGLRGHPVVFGSAADPWQPAEEHFRLTRAMLGKLTDAAGDLSGLEVRLHTRSSLIARDTDLLRELSRQARVTVVMSIASVDERINRLLEPGAPSAFRRLAAVEALARAGVAVGIHVSPVMAGLDEGELGLSQLLTRAANAGARFAGLSFMQVLPGQREGFLAQVTTAYPELSSRFRRVIGRRCATEDEQRPIRALFEKTCHHVGLESLFAAAPRLRPEREPAQLGLFDGADA